MADALKDILYSNVCPITQDIIKQYDNKSRDIIATNK